MSANVTPNATFNVGPVLNFNLQSDPADNNDGTVADFLATAPAGAQVSNLTGGSTDLQNTIFNFTGSFYIANGQSFSLSHDDGATLVINGQTVISSAGPTVDITSTGTYTGASGVQSVQLVYGENNGLSAVLSVAVPEPTTMVAGALLLLPFGASTLRKLRNRAV